MSHKSDLSAKQKAFIEEYFLDFNATRAAKRAGYRGDENVLAATGSRLLRYDKVKRRIAERFKAKCMSSDEVLARLADQARTDLGPFLIVNGDDLQIQIDKLRASGKTHLIKSIIPTKYGTKILFHDAQHALELIGKHHRLFVDRQEISGPDGKAIELKTSYDKRQHVRALATLYEVVGAISHTADTGEEQPVDTPEPSTVDGDPQSS